MEGSVSREVHLQVTQMFSKELVPGSLLVYMRHAWPHYVAQASLKLILLPQPPKRLGLQEHTIVLRKVCCVLSCDFYCHHHQLSVNSISSESEGFNET